jgi:hypothetical protein
MTLTIGEVWKVFRKVRVKHQPLKEVARQLGFGVESTAALKYQMSKIKKKREKLRTAKKYSELESYDAKPFNLGEYDLMLY